MRWQGDRALEVRHFGGRFVTFNDGSSSSNRRHDKLQSQTTKGKQLTVKACIQQSCELLPLTDWLTSRVAGLGASEGPKRVGLKDARDMTAFELRDDNSPRHARSQGRCMHQRRVLLASDAALYQARSLQSIGWRFACRKPLIPCRGLKVYKDGGGNTTVSASGYYCTHLVDPFDFILLPLKLLPIRDGLNEPDEVILWILDWPRVLWRQ